VLVPAPDSLWAAGEVGDSFVDVISGFMFGICWVTGLTRLACAISVHDSLIGPSADQIRWNNPLQRGIRAGAFYGVHLEWVSTKRQLLDYKPRSLNAVRRIPDRSPLG
jgi:hypothetical protein